MENTTTKVRKSVSETRVSPIAIPSRSQNHISCNSENRTPQIIANSGAHSLVTLTTALPAASTAPGLIEPGDQLEYQGQGDTGSPDRWRGYVLGISISASGSGAVNVNQTARVIRYHEH